MRTRSNGFETEIRSFSCFQHDSSAPTFSAGAGYITYVPDCCTVEKSGEHIDDVIGLSQPWPFKPCLHDKWRWDEDPGATLGQHSHRGPDHIDRVWDYSQIDVVGTAGYYGAGVIDRTLLPVLPLDDVDYYHLTRVWEDRIIPRLRPEIDLLVFLIELKDIADLAQSLLKKINSLPRLLRTLRKPGKIKLGLTLNRQLDNIADNWLEYNFALKPTVADLLGILNGLLRFRAKLHALKKGVGKIQKGHGGIKYPYNNWVPTFSSECPHYPGCMGGQCPYTYDDRKRALVVRPVGECYRRLGITVLYRYSLPDWFSGIDESIRALLQSIGLVPGLEVIWEIIPFSFVVDWFLPIGDLLSKYRIDPVPVKTEILDICFTQQTYLAAQVYLDLGCGKPNLLAGTVTREVYQREVGVDFLTRIPHFKWPNLFQLSLGAALLKKVKRKGKRL